MKAPLSEWTDELLLEAAASGDDLAFGEIYRRHQSRVFRFTFRMTGSADAAEDITHACFMSLLEDPFRYRRESGLATYLCAAARNQSLKRLRRMRREPPHEMGPVPADEGHGPLRRLLADEEARLVRDAVLALAPLHREVVILVEYEGLSLAGVAAIVGAEVGTVKVRLYRARQKLRRSLEPYVRGASASAAAARGRS
jgi:RNA polymerase sigma-70 factor, ECF subfamily